MVSVLAFRPSVDLELVFASVLGGGGPAAPACGYPPSQHHLLRRPAFLTEWIRIRPLVKDHRATGVRAYSGLLHSVPRVSVSVLTPPPHCYYCNFVIHFEIRCTWLFSFHSPGTAGPACS